MEAFKEKCAIYICNIITLCVSLMRHTKGRIFSVEALFIKTRENNGPLHLS